MKVNKKKFLISILAISTVVISSSIAIGINSINQTQHNTSNTTFDSINMYTSVPIAPPTMDEPLTPSTGGGSIGSGITSEYKIDWSNKTSSSKGVFFDGDLAYTNNNRTVLLGMNPNTSNTNVTLPSSVKEIRGYVNVTNTKTSTKKVVGAFEDIKQITSVSIGGSNVTIEANAFKGCISLESVIVQNNAIRSIGKSAFEGCTKLSSINLSSSLTTIESKAFKDTSSLKQITLPNNLKTINESAFEGSSLLSVNMKNTKVTTIGKNAFKNTSSLVNVTFPNSLNSIGESSFENAKITNVIITSSSLTNMGISAFKNCTNMTLFRITSKTSHLRSIPDSIFENCANLTNVEFTSASGTTIFRTIGKNAFSGTKIKSLNISGVRTIDDSAFKNCSQLTSLVGQNVLEFIGKNAFENSGLEVITSSRSSTSANNITYLMNIVKIGERAFYGTKITSFKSGVHLTTIGNDSFKNISTLKQVDLTLSKSLVVNNNAFDLTDLSKVMWPSKRVFRGNKIIF